MQNESRARSFFVEPSYEPLSGKRKVFYGLALFVSAVGLGSLQSSVLSLSVLAFLFLTVAVRARSPYPVTVTLVLTVLASGIGGGIRLLYELFLPDEILLSQLRNPFCLGCVFLSAAVGAAALATLLKSGRSGIFAVLLPIAAVGICFLWSRNLGYALPGLTVLPAGILLSLFTGKDQKRTAGVAAATVGFALSVAVAAMFVTYETAGTVAKDAFLSAVNGTRDYFTVQAMRMRDAYFNALAPTAGNEAAQAALERLTAIFSDEVMAALVQGIYNLLPGIVLMLSGIAGYTAQMLFQASSIADGRVRLFPQKNRMFAMGVPSAAVFLFSFLVSLFASDNSLFVAVCDNLTLVLLPGFLITGVQVLLVRLFRAKPGSRGFFLTTAGILGCCAFGTLLSLIALIGSTETLMTPMRKKIAQTLRERRDGDPDA